jgi:hypothetical protein
VDRDEEDIRKMCKLDQELEAVAARGSRRLERWTEELPTEAEDHRRLHGSNDWKRCLSQGPDAVISI